MTIRRGIALGFLAVPIVLLLLYVVPLFGVRSDFRRTIARLPEAREVVIEGRTAISNRHEHVVSKVHEKGQLQALARAIGADNLSIGYFDTGRRDNVDARFGAGSPDLAQRFIFPSFPAFGCHPCCLFCMGRMVVYGVLLGIGLAIVLPMMTCDL